MESLVTKFTYLTENQDIGVARISGQVDIANTKQFAAFLEHILATPCSTLILNLEGLLYMCSTGFGLLSSTAFGEEEEKQTDKKIAFCCLHPTIQRTFELFGLNHLCTAYLTQEAALQDLQSQASESSPPPSEERASSPPEQKSPSSATAFPVIKECPVCHKPVTFPQPGTYKCPWCNGIQEILEDGALARVTPSEPYDEIEVTLPSDPNHLRKIRDFIMSFATEMGYSSEERADIVMAVDEACSNAIEHAHHFDREKKLRLLARIEKDRFTISICDSGDRSFKEKFEKAMVDHERVRKTGRGMGLSMIKEIMDEISVGDSPLGGQMITMSKRRKPAES